MENEREVKRVDGGRRREGGGDHVLCFCLTNAPVSIQIRWLADFIRATYVGQE